MVTLMAGSVKKITRRVKRLLRMQDEPEKQTSPTKVIKPEEVIPPSGKRFPTTRRTRRPEDDGPKVEKLSWGVTHIIYPSPPPQTVVVRDPITKRVSRKRLDGGMSRTTTYYDKDGQLYDETRVDW